ncbi:hypothetical protein OJ998_30085 [Solirubrobacter taibaiensis]|nr:hypothetical protein [Solirubrobacter taibaiensis]
MSTLTQTSTYTITDVGKVVDRFAADYYMIAQATGLVGRDHVAAVCHDVKLMAQRRYLDRVDIVLRNSARKEIRAARYAVSTSASGWETDRPGNNLWPRQIGGDLRVVVGHSTDWWALTEQQRATFVQNECDLYWSATDIDTSYPGMAGRFDRRYASNAYGMERTIFEGQA